MDIKLISILANNNVYYIKTAKFNYYLSIPKNNNYELDLGILITANYKNIKEVYQLFDNTNIALLIPELNNNLFAELKTDYRIGLGTIDNILKHSFELLTLKNYKLNKKLTLIDNTEFDSIEHLLLSLYNNTITLKPIHVLQETNALKEENKKPEVLNPGNINFIVGGDMAERNLNAGINLEELNLKENEPLPVLKEQRAGFANYFLLAFISIAISFGLLALLLKK